MLRACPFLAVFNAAKRLGTSGRKSSSRLERHTRTSLRGRHSSRRILTSSCGFQQCMLGAFQERDGLLARNGGKIVKELFKRIPRLQIIKKGLDGDPRPCKAG